MANKNILTYNAKVSKVEQDYYSPVATIGQSGLPVGTFYCFLSKVQPWTNEINPEQPRQDQKYIKHVFKNMFVAKKIKANEISPVIERINWTSGVTYSYYRDDIDMFQVDQNGLLINKFYVKNRYDQVFKCLWNNNGAESLNEPLFQPGSYGDNNIFTGSDGYKWKYIYTIDIGSKTKFMDSSWLPIPVSISTLNPIQSTSGCGDIDVINIIDGGSGYDITNSIITVNIEGDGSDASATAEVSNGSISRVIVTNTGSNYTFANSTIVTTGTGSGAVLVSPVSPIGGHGFDPLSELACSHVMFTSEFNSSEKINGVQYLPTDIDYRQVGLLVNPVSLSTYPNPANSSIYKISTDITVASGFGSYAIDEVVYQGDNLETSYFSATVLSFDEVSNIIKLINITGTPSLNAPIFGYSSKTVRTCLGVSYPDFIKHSGYMVYIENRESVQRSYDGIEQFKFVLHY